MQPDRSASEISGRVGQLFASTRWSVVLRAKDGSFNALSSLCAVYFKPLLVWLQCRGEQAETAEDLVQGFFEHLLSRDFLKGVGQGNGHFRSYLLKAFKCYLIDQHKRSQAKKRGGGKIALSLDETDENGMIVHLAADPALGPDAAYDRAWAAALLTQAFARLAMECSLRGHPELLAALEPVLFEDKNAPAYEMIGRKLGMSTGTVRMAALRLRRRLKGIIREEVCQTLKDPRELVGELTYLRSLFAKPAAFT